MKADRIVLGVTLLAVGVIWFLVNTGLLESVSAREMLRFWPLLLVLWGLIIILGKSDGTPGCLVPLIIILLVFGGFISVFVPTYRTAPENSYPVRVESVPGTDALALDIIHYAGEFTLSSHSGSTYLEGNIRSTERPEVKHSASSGKAEISIHEPSGQWPYRNRFSHWSLTLPEQLPAEVVFRTGAAQAEFDLSRLHVTELRIQMGAGELTIKLGSNDTRISIDGGAGSINFLVPEDTGVRLTTTGGLLSVEGENARVFSVGERRYESRDMADKEAVAEIKITAGAGSVKLTPQR
jgi:hypothetical protein